MSRRADSETYGLKATRFKIMGISAHLVATKREQLVRSILHLTQESVAAVRAEGRVRLLGKDVPGAVAAAWRPVFPHSTVRRLVEGAADGLQLSTEAITKIQLVAEQELLASQHSSPRPAVAHHRPFLAAQRRTSSSSPRRAAVAAVARRPLAPQRRSSSSSPRRQAPACSLPRPLPPPQRRLAAAQASCRLPRAPARRSSSSEESLREVRHVYQPVPPRGKKWTNR